VGNDVLGKGFVIDEEYRAGAGVVLVHCKAGGIGIVVRTKIAK
jgi:hypothetical protein